MLARQVVAFAQALRARDFYKAPGIAETLDWAEALVALDRIALDPQTVTDTIGVLLKYQDDIGAITPEVAAKLVAEAQALSIGVTAAAGTRRRSAQANRVRRSHGPPRRGAPRWISRRATLPVDR